MTKKGIIPLKVIAFLAVFWALSALVAFLLRDDSGSYGRVLLHELYEQENIDILYCGSSHVSHGIVADIADEMTGKTNFSTGTAAQSIQGTYAILKQAVKRYDIKTVFLEMEFAISTQTPPSRRDGFKSDYLVANGIKDPQIKLELLTSISTPKYYLNHFLPIGKDKYLTLNPKSLAYRAKSFVNGDYFRYEYESDDDEYAGRGCLLDYRVVKNGTFSETAHESPINLSAVSEEYLATVDKIIALCKEKGVELIFYSMPCTDFYLGEKGNYDEYHALIRDFLASRGFDFYDFNLAKESYMRFEDEDFRDDNHFNAQGCKKWTRLFWEFFLNGKPKEEFFYDSYKERMAAMSPRIFGLVYDFKDDKRHLEIKPIYNHLDNAVITYDVTASFSGTEEVLAQNSTETTWSLPRGKAGKIRVVSYLDGVKQNDCRENFAAF